ncbi:hypothetical protein ACOSQ2_005967 [Xanthoceras sorbifolium]
MGTCRHGRTSMMLIPSPFLQYLGFVEMKYMTQEESQMKSNNPYDGLIVLHLIKTLQKKKKKKTPTGSLSCLSLFLSGSGARKGPECRV